MAHQSGFETSAGFNKAFKQQFGLSLLEYRHQNLKGGRLLMKFTILKKEAFSAVGYHILPREGKVLDVLESGAYWFGEDFKNYAPYYKGCFAKGKIGAWMHPLKKSGDMYYFFGYIDEDLEAPKGFKLVNIPAGEYAVFEISKISDEPHGKKGLVLEIRKT